jgi:hypothetical protein
MGGEVEAGEGICQPLEPQLAVALTLIWSAKSWQVLTNASVTGVYGALGMSLEANGPYRHQPLNLWLCSND